MAGINKAILVGNLGKDPEMRYTPNGVAVCSFPMATSETYKDRNTGERVTQTEWHNIVIWRGMAETAENTCAKARRSTSKAKSKPDLGRTSRPKTLHHRSRGRRDAIARSPEFIRRSGPANAGRCAAGQPAAQAQPAVPASAVPTARTTCPSNRKATSWSPTYFPFFLQLMPAVP